MKPNNKVEFQKVFRPTSLSSGEQFFGTELFQFFVISNNIYRQGRTLKIVSPMLESFENCH